MPPIIKTRNLTRIYRPDTVPVYALNGVDLDIEEGEFTAIVGPSGSGKTTLLNMIGGLDRPSSGEVIIDGTKIHDLSDSQLIDFRRTHIGFVFQAYNLIPVLTARENVEFVMLLQRWSREERHRRVLELMKAVGLEEKLDSRPAQLSGGQQQRVAVARALASRPRFVLADEPTANLDSQSSGKLLDMMARLNREEKMTFLFSTHDQRVIDRARRVVTLVDGKVDSDLVRDTVTPPS